MSVRAKFKVTELTQRSGYKGVVDTVIKLHPVGPEGSEENKQFYKWTPGGAIELGVVAPEAAAKFELGREYYVDFTAAPADEAAAAPAGS